MNYCFRNRPQKLSIKQLRFAVKLFSEQLFSRRLRESLDIAIIFQHDLLSSEGMHGRCDPDPDFYEPDRNPRNFCIQIDSKQSVKNIFRTLAHEMVHVKQFAQGRLKEYPKNNARFRWEGKIFVIDNSSDEQYFFSPWEIEAFGYEEGLYNILMTRWKNQ